MTLSEPYHLVKVPLSEQDNLTKTLVTYQKISNKNQNSIEQVPHMHHAAWCLLKKSLKLGQTIGFVPNSLNRTILKNNYGKPYFKYHPNLYFNLSHTIGCVACIVSETEVGIDIEKIRPYQKKIVCKVCTPLEQEWINQSDNPNEAFFRLWTLKESIVKANGTGINQSLKHFEFLLSDKEEFPNIKVKLEDNLKYHFNQVIIDNQFVLSTCNKQ